MLFDSGPISSHGIVRCPEDWQVTEPHGPGYSRIYHITGGGAIYRDAAGTHQLKPGHLYLFPENSAYQMRHNPADPLCCLYIHASLFPLVLHGMQELPVEPGHFLDHLLAAMADLIRSSDSLPLLQSLLTALIIWLSENIVLQQPRPEILQVLKYIQTNSRDTLTVSTLSQLVCWQKQYFIRQFRRETGITPHQYLLRYRLHQASLLLLQNIPVTEAARQSGFTDLKSFSKAFRTKYQIAPSRYPNYYRNIP
ncbi:MAG TPA: hypothetical protein DD640_09480 [Clostridiales bacterium]|nr:hypothetical protein [Clostridiales bacterium]